MKIEEIKDPSFLKDMSNKELKQLANEIREFLITKISNTGGHLSSNLGIVELTIALHYVFNSPKDKFIFDVGHQAYTHKILTGRAKEFDRLRKKDGLSGFISYDESSHDVWESGHSSTSLSAQAGFLCAQDKNDGRVISIIGDSSIANGVAFEGLNYLGNLKGKDPIVILNDNEMGISKSVGQMSKLFTRMRSSEFYRNFKATINKCTPSFISNFFHRIKTSMKGFAELNNMFEDMGFHYYGPYDGNDIVNSIKILERLKGVKGPIIIHFITKKGKGYSFAENDISGNFHSVQPFEISTGLPKKAINNKKSYASLATNALIEVRKEKEIKVICPAMVKGSELEEFEKLYPNDIYDVGIAEEHAVVMAAALAKAKKKVAVIIYSTFAQRAYDQIVNDICRSDLPVVFGIDHADFVAGDGSTHQGIYDLAMLLPLPNIIVTMPSNEEEMLALFKYAFNQNHPMAIRYYKSNIKITESIKYEEINKPVWKILNNGEKMVIISYGPNVNEINSFVQNNGYDIKVINALFIKPLDEKILKEILKSNKPIIIYENVVEESGLGIEILKYANRKGFNTTNIHIMAIPTENKIPVASVEELKEEYFLSLKDIQENIKKYI